MTRSVLAVCVLVSLAAVVGAGELARADDNGDVPAEVRVTPLTLRLFLGPDSIDVGEEAGALVVLQNHGAEAISAVSVTLRAQPAGVATSGSWTRTFSTVGPGQERAAAWGLCGLQPGNYVLMATATATLSSGAQIASESNAQLLEVRSGKSKRCPKAYR